MGFDISDDLNNRKPLSAFDIQLQRAFLNDYQYLTLTVMGAVAEAIAANIVVWVQHLQEANLLVVHREYQVRVGTS